MPKEVSKGASLLRVIQAMASTGEAHLADPHSCYATAVTATPERGRTQDRASPELWRTLHQDSQGTLGLGQQCWQLSLELTPRLWENSNSFSTSPAKFSADFSGDGGRQHSQVPVPQAGNMIAFHWNDRFFFFLMQAEVTFSH